MEKITCVEQPQCPQVLGVERFAFKVPDILNKAFSMKQF